MCTILFSYKSNSVYDLIMASNRDEYYSRPTTPVHFWEDSPQILAGRDLQNNGTWLGVTKSGRMAAITNFRKPSSLKADAPSRGLLVSNYLNGCESPAQYLEKIQETGPDFNGFNLLVGDTNDLYYYSNMEGCIRKINPGFHGLSNHLINTPWTKVAKGKKNLIDLVNDNERIESESIFELLSDNTCPPDSELPETGVGIEWERILAPIFIKSDAYGTRSSSVLLINRNGYATYIERTFEPVDPVAGKFKVVTKKFNYQIEGYKNS